MAETSRSNAVVELQRDGEIALVVVNAPPVNALSLDVREGLAAAFRQAVDDDSAKAVLLICQGRTFIAGADIAEIGKPPQSPTLRDVLPVIEAAPKPVVAAIHGTALGGGLETALACHYRVAVPSAKVGLPEVKLGLLPGAGGTQRLPRLVGPEKALEMIAFGEAVGAQEALDLGILDELVEEGRLRDGALVFARRILAEGGPWPKVRDREDRIAPARGDSTLFDGFRKANARRFRGVMAPEACIQAVEAAVNLPFVEGLALERGLFAELVASPESAARRHVFFAERQVWKIPDVPEDMPTLPIRRIGVIGAGTMGGGIAMSFANASIPVTLVETSREALERGLATIRRNYESTVKRGRLAPEEARRRRGLVEGTLAFEALGACDLVIEAVFESMDLKKEVFARLDGIAKEGAILASNTSYLDIDAIAAATGRPEQVVGLHFFSPANVMRLIEVVRGEKTAKPVIATAMRLARAIGKIGVLVGVAHGFVGNRMLQPRQREANRLVLEGAMPWDVDRALVEFGFPMGPFAMSDLAGLDIGWRRETSTGETLKDILCEMDRRGQKTGAGFYDYDEARNATPSPVVASLARDLSARKGFVRRSIPEEEIRERCLYVMINEAARILEEGKALRASDIDVVWINGYGWPAYRGGPMYHAGQVGLARIVERLQAYEAERGADFTPAPLLVRLAAEGRSFSDF